ncbi:MAG: prolipoprotein diacylglyceryl transferase [Clostridia bacterium]|nr:prolipoprotein diacylglyceryl transferase [Clostridia bacterium]
MIDPVAFTINIDNGAVVKDIYWYGIIIATGMILALLVAIRNAKRMGKKPEMIIDFSVFAIVLAIIGARAHYVVWSWEFFEGEPFWKVFAIWEGGLAIYGGIIGGVIAAIIYTRFKKISLLALLDIMVPSLILGQSIGRWGNFANQEAFGYPVFNEKFWHFPITVFIERTSQYHLATFFYESLWDFIGFIILMVSLRKSKKEGKTFFLYMIIYGLGRVVIEGLRTDSQMFLNTNIRINQVLSALFIIVGGALYLFSRSSKDYVLVSDEEETEPKKSRPSRIQVRKVDEPKRSQSESVINEYKAVTDEMRRQREKSKADKETDK